MHDRDVPPARRVYCNRTLNLRSIGAIGYDLDYTLVHYDVAAWEGRAYEHVKALLAARGWPVEGLRFDPERIVRGLVLDTELGNVVKANRFGYIVAASHGTRALTYEERRRVYGRTLVDLGEPRWWFLNTLFSLSEGCLFAQLVDLHDAGRLEGVAGYRDLFVHLHRASDEAHLQGELKAEILADPERYVELDPEVPLVLLDQREAGKRLMLVTNSEWTYVRDLLDRTLDPLLPAGLRWRELFELVIVAARKPAFFTQRLPLFRIVDERGLLEPAPLGFSGPGCYLGGDATQVEAYLGLQGDEILFVGDHIWADIRVAKGMLRWRTALILKELEAEIEALLAFRPRERELERLMAEKERLEARLRRALLGLQRHHRGYGPRPRGAAALERRVRELEERIEALDREIAPLAREAAALVNPHWGPLLRAGNDKSLLARQLEGAADVYASRVTNFLAATPFAFFRAVRGPLPHEPR